MKNYRKCTYLGHVYYIPDAWIMGYTQDGSSVEEAIKYWHYQAMLEHEWYATHRVNSE